MEMSQDFAGFMEGPEVSSSEISLEDIVQRGDRDEDDPNPQFFKKLLVSFLGGVARLDEINTFLSRHEHVRDWDFLDLVLEELDFSFALSNRDRQRIPSSGPLVCVSNHPLGALDGLAVLRAIGEVRRDVFLLVERDAFVVDNLKNLFVRWDESKVEGAGTVSGALAKGAAVICFPAVDVSRLSTKGVRDGAWTRDVVAFSRKHKAPVLPVFVDGRNSLSFHFASMIRHHWGTLLLPREAMRQKGATLRIYVGNPIPVQAFAGVHPSAVMKLLRKHVLAQGKKKRKPIFRTENTVIHPVDRQNLKRELASARRLVPDGSALKVFLLPPSTGTGVLREIARLRELTFRQVGEGTGKRMDLDGFDPFYHHLVVWDDTRLEIAGAYRLGLGSELRRNGELGGFYVSSLFELQKPLIEKLPVTLELGRSFVQQAYWNTRALDRLWQGIGAFLKDHAEIRYLMGPVSISSLFPAEVKDLLVFFFGQWFGPDELGAVAKNPYHLNAGERSKWHALFPGVSYREDWRVLKDLVRSYGFAVPTLFRQYTNLCNHEGVTFHGFNVDPAFSNCVDGLIVVDLAHLKPSKRSRYFGSIRKRECSCADS